MKNYKVLIADDDRDHLRMVASICRNAGFEVLCATGTDDAINTALEERPDLLLLDIHMNDSDSYGIQQRLQDIGELCDTPVIYVTGDKSSWVEAMTDIFGAEEVLRKPFDIDKLILAMRQALVKRESSKPSAATIGVQSFDSRKKAARTASRSRGK